MPRDVSLHKLFDESEASRKWLRRVLRHFGVAIVVTAIATYLFLGLRTALAVFGAVAVWLPVSASVLWAAGLTLNVMTVVVILFAGVALVWFTLRLAVAPMFALLALTALIGVLFWRDALGVYAHAFLGFGMLTFVAGPVAWLVSAFTGVTTQAGTFMSGGLASRWPGHRGVLASLLGALILIAATWHVFSLSATLGTPVDGGTVALRVYGPQEGQLPVLADGVRARLRTLPEIADVSDPLERRQRWHLQLDEEKLRAADIGIIEVGRHFEIARSGLVVGRLTDAEAQMPLRVQLAPGAAGPAFEHLLLRGERPERPALYLRDVGMAEEADLPRERLRVQRRPALEIRAHWRGAAIPDAVVRLPDTVELPAGYELQLDVAPSSPTEAAIP